MGAPRACVQVSNGFGRRMIVGRLVPFRIGATLLALRVSDVDVPNRPPFPDPPMLMRRLVLLSVLAALLLACSDDTESSSSDRFGRDLDARGAAGGRDVAGSDEDPAEDDASEQDPSDVEDPEETTPSEGDTTSPEPEPDTSNPLPPPGPDPRRQLCGPHLTQEDLDAPDAPVCEFFAHTRNRLYAIDPYRKTIRDVGAMGSATFFDIDTHPDGRLFGIRTSAPYSLSEVDVTTGSYRDIMTLQGVTGTANGLCIDAGGVIFVTADTRLYRVDEVNRRVEAAPQSIGHRSSGDCVFERKSNDLYMSARPAGTLFSSRADDLVFIDAVTGAGSVVGRTNHFDIYGLTVAWDVLYGVTGRGELIEISMADGSSTLIHNFGSSYEFMGAASTPLAEEE